MEALDKKRARLRSELQQAYSAWMVTSEGRASPGAAQIPIDISGCPDPAKARWFDYLAAKQRLVLAYAERPVTV
jgi:hypothetical protein